MKTLIANTGIQIFSQRVNINLQNVREKMYFREWFDINTYRLSLELVHYFANDEVYVRKSDLWKKGFMPHGVVSATWDDIQQQTSDVTKFKEEDVFSISCQTLLKSKQPLLDKFYIRQNEKCTPCKTKGTIKQKSSKLATTKVYCFFCFLNTIQTPFKIT